MPSLSLELSSRASPRTVELLVREGALLTIRIDDPDGRIPPPAQDEGLRMIRGDSTLQVGVRSGAVFAPARLMQYKEEESRLYGVAVPKTAVLEPVISSVFPLEWSDGKAVETGRAGPEIALVNDSSRLVVVRVRRGDP